MAYNPYFRYGSIDTLDLGQSVMAPNFPVQSGLTLHTYPSGKNSYTTTSRLHGNTNFTYTIKDVKRDDLETIKDFWNTLSQGYYDFTIIDNRARMLFDASWITWRKRWRKQYGGIYDIIINIDSSFPWTPPCLGAYLMTTNNLNNHTLQGSNLTVTDGALTTQDSDSNVLRSTGYALKMTGNGTSSLLTGATGTVDWKSNIEGSLSIFCQFRGVAHDTQRVNLVQLTNSINTNSYALWQTDTEFGGEINGSFVGVSAGTYHAISTGTWYDCAISYDAHNDNIYVYIAPSALTSFTNFRSGSTDIADGTGTYMSVPEPPSATGYTVVNLLTDSGTGGIANGEDGYLQNVMVFDGHITPHYFNTLRRLCYMWNNKTQEWPK
jgi:hypothetical protein